MDGRGTDGETVTDAEELEVQGEAGDAAVFDASVLLQEVADLMLLVKSRRQ